MLNIITSIQYYSTSDCYTFSVFFFVKVGLETHLLVAPKFQEALVAALVATLAVGTNKDPLALQVFHFPPKRLMAVFAAFDVVITQLTTG